MTPEVGKTYQFNRAVAVVLELANDYVVWRDRDQPRVTLKCPRWFFEKCATALPNGDL